MNSSSSTETWLTLINSAKFCDIIISVISATSVALNVIMLSNTCACSRNEETRYPSTIWINLNKINYRNRVTIKEKQSHNKNVVIVIYGIFYNQARQHYFLSPTLQILDIRVGCNWKSARSVLATGHSCSLLTILNHIYKEKKEQGTTYLLYSIKTIFTINTTANFYLTVKFSYAFLHFGANFVFRNNDRFWK